MKKVASLLLVIFAVLFSFAGVGTFAYADGVNDYLNEDNWLNLPGYEYITSNLKAENNAKYPAEVVYGESEDDVGINLKIKGYYQSGYGDENGNGFAGIVYKNKVSLDGFSVTFTCNKLGASSNASPADDGWISVAFLSKCNMFSTTNTAVNMGAVALVRPSNRGCIVYLHEIASDDNGYKIANFAKGTNVSVELDTAPSFEGSTIRVSFVKVEDPTGTKYYLKVEQLNFETGEVLASKTSNNPFEAPHIYTDADGKGYLAFSASSDNFDKSWDLSIKNICGTTVGKKADQEPISATERAGNIYDLITKLQIYSYFELDGKLSAEGKAFYTPDCEININDLATQLSVQLFNADNDTIAKLADMDAVFSQFDTKDQYIAFLKNCNSEIIQNYETIRIDRLISRIESILSTLPSIENVSLSNEQSVSANILDLQTLYGSMNAQAIEKYTQEKYDLLWETIVRYTDKLSDVSIEKFDNIIRQLPQNVTGDNLKQTVLDLVTAELIYEKLEDELATISVNNPTGYKKLVEGKQVIDKVRAGVEDLRGEYKRIIENYENAGNVIFKIFYLPASPAAEDMTDLRDLLTSYYQLNDEAKAYITEKGKLLAACVSSLDLAIKAAPDYTEITAENYLQNNYDTMVNELSSMYNLIDTVDGSQLANLSNAEKYKKLKGKMDSIMSPVSAIQISKITLNADETKEITFAEMFHNYYGKNVNVTTNYGVVDKTNETLVLSFKEGGTYTVTVEITDVDYNQSAKCEFTVEVIPAKKQGCKSSLGGGLFAVLSVAICAAIVLVGKKRI